MRLGPIQWPKRRGVEVQRQTEREGGREGGREGKLE